ncbi:MAG TPA: hypothetical protein VLA88_02065 [Candidatus Saccharimonadales bacterium]|nr:hypothetical protein [Candidatus Saccharimonadales bacterium]
MTSSETPGIGAINRAFPADHDFPAAPYRELALAESGARRITSLDRAMPGLLRPIVTVRNALTGNFPPEKVEGYVAAMEARQLRLNEKLAEGTLRIRSLIGLAALRSCTPEMAAHTLTMMRRGYEVGLIDRELTGDDLGGDAVDHSVVLDGSHGGLYVQQDPERAASVKEYFVAGYSDQQAGFAELHETLAEQVVGTGELVERLETIQSSH